MAHRVGKKQGSSNRPIIARLASMRKRNEIMNSLRGILKEKRKKKESLIDVLRVRECMTPFRASSESRELQQEIKWSSRYVREGKIFVQHFPSPAHAFIIRTARDLEKLKTY